MLTGRSVGGAKAVPASLLSVEATAQGSHGDVAAQRQHEVR